MHLSISVLPAKSPFLLHCKRLRMSVILSHLQQNYYLLSLLLPWLLLMLFCLLMGSTFLLLPANCESSKQPLSGSPCLNHIKTPLLWVQIGTPATFHPACSRSQEYSSSRESLSRAVPYPQLLHRHPDFPSQSLNLYTPFLSLLSKHFDFHALSQLLSTQPACFQKTLLYMPFHLTPSPLQSAPPVFPGS